MGNIKIKNKIPLIFTILIGLAIVGFFLFFLKTNILHYEDFVHCFFSPGFVNFYTEADHGRLISWLLMKLVGTFIPELMSMHPNSCWVSNLIVALGLAVYIFLISNFASLFSNKKLLKPVWYILSFASIYPLLFTLFLFSIMTYCRYFGYIFITIFYFLFWQFFLKSFVEQKPITNGIVYISIVAFFVGLSTEPVNLSTFFSIILILLIQFLIMLFEGKAKVSIVLNRFKSIIKSLYSPIFSFLLGFFIYYSNPNFWKWAIQREVDSNFNWSHIINLFPEFTIEWFKTLFIYDSRWLLSISLVFLSILIILIKKNCAKNIRVVLSAWILIFGASLFYFTLIIPGRTFYDGVNFWLVSQELRSFISVVFLSANFLLIGYLTEYIFVLIKKEKIISVFLGIISVIILTATCINSKSAFYEAINCKKQFEHTMYKMEKMYLFYAQRNEDAILPQSLSDDPDIGYIILAKGCFKANPSWFIRPYYFCIYKKGTYVPIKLLPDDKAMQEFYSRGGTFEEGEIEKANFNKLFDKDFVLNKKITN